MPDLIPPDPLLTATVYVNEDLTNKRARLLWRARTAKKEKRIQDCWTSDGNLLVKTNQNRIEMIKGLADFDKF